MITTIDNNQRKFIIQSQGFGNTTDIVCNLDHIPLVIQYEFKDKEFIIVEYWNRRLKKCSKKHLNDMFKAHSIKFRVK